MDFVEGEENDTDQTNLEPTRVICIRDIRQNDSQGPGMSHVSMTSQTVEYLGDSPVWGIRPDEKTTAGSGNWSMRGSF